MCDRLIVHDRCIAIQLQKDAPPPKYSPSEHQGDANKSPSRSSLQLIRGSRFLPFQYGSLPRSKRSSQNAPQKKEGSTSSPSSPSQGNATLSPSEGNTFSPVGTNSSGTPTPTNVAPVALPSSSNQNSSPGSINCFQNYHEGYRLYQSWVNTNSACVWDEELVKAVRGTHFVGVLVGGFILIGGPPRVLAAICHAHSQALLNPPPGWVIVVLGELRECDVVVVQRGHFTPLGEALCWVIYKLTSSGITADQNAVRKALLVKFPFIAPPEPAIIHAALSDLIRLRKVFHTGKGYGIVNLHTYTPESVPSDLKRKDNKNEPPRLLTTSEALTRAHGAAEVEVMGDVTHAAVQTDLADLLSGIWPNSSILKATPPSVIVGTLQRTGSFRGCSDSARLILVGENSRILEKERYQVYVGIDMSDVTIKGGDKSSVLSKILRVSQPRRRLASFNAQFPPPEWSNNSGVKHLHSVASQTGSPKHPGGPESCCYGHTQWAPRSSTLPRRPPRPLSSSPVPLEAHFRPHSASPSSTKLLQGCPNYRSQAHEEVQGHQVVSSSSPSPCVTSSRSSRNQSPSLHSTALTQADNNTYSCSSGSPKYNSGSIYSTNDRGYVSSPVRLNQPPKLLSQRAAARKPPVSASPHYTTAKEQKIKLLSYVTQESADLENYHRRNDKRSSAVDMKCISARHLSSSPVRSRGKARSPQIHGRSSSEGNSRLKELTDESNLQRTRSKESQLVRDITKDKYNRTNLKLELLSCGVTMNNYRKVVSSPQKPEGLKNNVFHENFSSSITKGSLSDLASKNIAYRDVNKYDKNLYSEETHHNGGLQSKIRDDIEVTDNQTISVIENNPTKRMDEKRKLKLSLPISESVISSEENLKKAHRKSLIILDNANETKDKEKTFASPQDDIRSVKTYPSLSELNLTFSSLAAQKILQGVSVNSIDTLVEVNMLAEKKQKRDDSVTNTDFGFV